MGQASRTSGAHTPVAAAAFVLYRWPRSDNAGEGETASSQPRARPRERVLAGRGEALNIGALRKNSDPHNTGFGSSSHWSMNHIRLNRWLRACFIVLILILSSTT